MEPKGFYEGETARLIVEEMSVAKDLSVMTDLKNYTAKEREPGCFSLIKKIIPIITMPLAQQRRYSFATDDADGGRQDLKQYGFETVQSVHLMTEVERLAYADRAKYLGDPDFFKVPVKTLISYPYVYGKNEKFQPRFCRQ